MRQTALLILLALLMFSCTKDEPVYLDQISRFAIYNINGEIESENDFGFDTKGRLIYRSGHLYSEIIQYSDQNIYRWDFEYEPPINGVKSDTYFYSNNKLDSIQRDNPSNILGIELTVFYYEDDLCVRKEDITNGGIAFEYHYVYNEEKQIVDCTINIFNPYQNSTHYDYEYDENGNITTKYIGGKLYRYYEYTDYKNPLYQTSKAYLTKCPIFLLESEHTSITSKYLLSKEIRYTEENFDQEITYEYTLNNIGLPETAIMKINKPTFPETRFDIIYEYQ